MAPDPHPDALMGQAIGVMHGLEESGSATLRLLPQHCHKQRKRQD